MASYLAEKYASLVNAEMIMTLFEKLTKYLGDSRAKAADECGITRKAIYDWDNLKEEIKLSTKEKVLDQLLEQMPVETLDYLSKQMHDYSSDAIMSYLSTIYEKTFDTKTESEFLQLTNRFEDATKRYAGLIYKKLDYEVDDMAKQLVSLAKSNSILWKPTLIHLYDSEDLKKIIPQIINAWIYYGLPQTPEELSLRLKVPLEVVNVVGQTLNKEFFPITHPKQSLEKTSSGITKLPFEVGYYITNKTKTMMSNAATRHYEGSSSTEVTALTQ